MLSAAFRKILTLIFEQSEIKRSNPGMCVLQKSDLNLSDP
jgi:hypothetical protein